MPNTQTIDNQVFNYMSRSKIGSNWDKLFHFWTWTIYGHTDVGGFYVFGTVCLEQGFEQGAKKKERTAPFLPFSFQILRENEILLCSRF
jgi:hypothetical protein